MQFKEIQLDVQNLSDELPDVPAEPCRQVHIFFGEMNKNVLYHRCPLISGTITRLICSGLNIFSGRLL